MRIAYLILAHDNPRHLGRLIGALSSESASFFIHLDRKSHRDDFAEIRGERVFLLPERVAVYWADFSLVEATLLLLRAALSGAQHFDYCVLISGTDYPLQSAAYIDGFFARHAGTEFMNLVQMPCEALGKSLSRLTTYQARPGEPLSGMVKRARRLLVRAGVRTTERDHRPHLRHLVPYGGSQWWALSTPACEYILGFVSRERQVVDFFRHTVCPDEVFFQTVLGNSSYKNAMQRNLTYTDWSAGGSSPALLSERHLELFSPGAPIVLDNGYGPGEVLFARKFSDRTEDVVARLDALIGAGEGRRTSHSR